MKTSYHPAVTVAFFLGCLPPELIERIPPSTRFDWKHKNLSLLFGYDWYFHHQHLFNTLQQISTNKKLLRVNRALLRVIAIKRFITRYAACIKEGLFNLPNVIAQNIGKAGTVLGLSKTLRFLQLPYVSYLKLKKSARCISSPLNLCRIKHPLQLLSKEIAVVNNYGVDPRFLHWSLCSLYWQIIRDRAAFMHISTFYKYISHLKLSRTPPPHRRKNHRTGIRAAAPLQLLHADTTGYITGDHQKAYIYLIEDNFSKAILQSAVSPACKAQIMFENLCQVNEKYLIPAGVARCQLITDDGSENYGPVKQLITSSRNPVIQHVIAQKDIEFSNSMIEAVNKQLKYRFLYHKHIPDLASLKEYVRQAVDDYNNRPHHALHGLTPLEVLNGQKPDLHAYSQQINRAKAIRLTENKKTKCCYSF